MPGLGQVDNAESVVAEPHGTVFEELHPSVVWTTMVLYSRHDVELLSHHFGTEDPANTAHELVRLLQAFPHYHLHQPEITLAVDVI